jgi:hypothetical protein
MITLFNNLQRLMTPEGLMPGPQDPTTGPSCESDESSPHPLLMYLCDAV